MQGVDIIMNGVGQGEVASLLLQNGLDFRALKAWIGKDGRTYINSVDQMTGKIVPKLVHNSVGLLRKEEWIALDRAVMQAANLRLVAANDLISRGLVYNIPNGMGTTVFQSQNMSDLNDAAISMTGLEETTNEKLQFDLSSIPLPIIHKDLKIPIRLLAASRNGGAPLDTLEAQIAGRKIAEMAEQILLGTTTFPAFSGGTIYGYTTFPQRQTYSISDWESNSTTGDTIKNELIAMIGAANDQRQYGPFMLYVTPDMALNFERDFKANSDKTIRMRLMELQPIADIKPLDFMPADTALLVPMNPETVRMIVGMVPQTLTWDSKGGLLTHLKVMTIMVPQIRNDFYGRCGIVHATYSGT